MGLCKLVDAFLFLYFLFIAVVGVLFDAQAAVPSHLFPDVLVDMVSSYARDFGDYLVSEKPDFFIGVTYVELIVQLPVAVASLYGILAKKSWVRTTCLIYGVSTLSTMIVILTEMTRSKRASEKLLRLYWPFLGISVLAVLRGLVPCSASDSTTGRRSAAARKKRA